MNHLDILNRATERVEIRITENDQAAADDTQAVHHFKLLVAHLGARLRNVAHVLQSGEASEELGAARVLLHGATAFNSAREASRMLVLASLRSIVIWTTLTIWPEARVSPLRPVSLQFESVALL